LTFQLSGLEIVGNEPEDMVVKVEIGPGEEQFIQLNSNSGAYSFKVSISYGIEWC
jgi:hypothetical protein